ncbi:hypothetical protein JOC77_002593 [Peribacillus deserti]|uniref:Uncharacterized protein n=1 Tax=Peribacillus deserti TaxID=673318 RepID=A0ABS2QKC7_9BACI|nr:hypothetical protein [Peribacillus deserti]
MFPGLFFWGAGMIVSYYFTKSEFGTSGRPRLLIDTSICE